MLMLNNEKQEKRAGVFRKTRPRPLRLQQDCFVLLLLVFFNWLSSRVLLEQSLGS